MKIIDLLNKIANGEKVPLKIKVKGYEYRQSNGQFWCDETEMYLIDNCTSIYHLNNEVEILEEEKKIPEKLDVIGWDKCIHNVTHKEKELAIEINKTQKLLNQLLDYLKSKGDE